MKYKHRGFTLIELMIGVAIVGILSAIALPSYRQYIQRSNRVDAKNTLMSAAQRMEQNYSLSGRYDQTQDAAAVDTALLGTWGLNKSPAAGATLYNITLSSVSTTAYVLKATPTGAQATDTCGILSITERNLKAAKGDNPNTAGVSRNAATRECWSK